MFGINYKNQQDDNLASPANIVNKSDTDLPDGLGGADHGLSGPANLAMPPIMAGPISLDGPPGPLRIHDEQAGTPPTQSIPAPAPQPASHDEVQDKPNDENLLKMKQQALQSLAPLVNHLDQTPEEKFKTIMMLLQASDNQELVK